MSQFEYQTDLTCSLEGLFEFFRKVQNTALVTAPELGILFTSAPEFIEQGSRIDFQVVTFGQVVKSSHHITTFDPNVLVVEEQLEGPMKSWIHRHEYERTDTGVIKRDVIEFEKPGGLVGLLLTEQKILDYLDDSYYYQEQKLKEFVASGKIQ